MYMYVFMLHSLCLYVCLVANVVHYILFRVKFVAARDGLLPSFLSGVHNKYRTPLPAIVVSVSLEATYIRIYPALKYCRGKGQP